MLEMFKQDATKKEQEEILYNSKCTYHMNLHPWVQHVWYLSRAARYLPCLADHREAPEGVEQMDKPLTEVKLCGLILRAIPNEWADTYRVGGDELVPANSDRLLTKLEKLKLRNGTASAAPNSGASKSPKSSAREWTREELLRALPAARAEVQPKKEFVAYAKN